MKPVLIHFTDSQGQMLQTYSTCSLKTGMMDNLFDIAERAESMQQNQLRVTEAKKFFADLKGMIVEVFGNQFTYQELNEGAEHAEIMRVFKELCANITGEMQKN